MPYQEYWVPPEVALLHKGVTVYHAYEGRMAGRKNLFIYGLDYYENVEPFDIRDYRDDLPMALHSMDTEEQLLKALRFLIDAGLLKPSDARSEDIDKRQ